MKISSIPAVSPVRQKLTALYHDKVFSMMKGDYKGYKNASVEYAKLAVDNFEEVTKIQKVKVSVPFFSKINFNAMKVWFLDHFRRKTPEEKALYQMGKDYKLRQDIFQQQNDFRR